MRGANPIPPSLVFLVERPRLGSDLPGFANLSAVLGTQVLSALKSNETRERQREREREGTKRKEKESNLERHGDVEREIRR